MTTEHSFFLKHKETVKTSIVARTRVEMKQEKHGLLEKLHWLQQGN